MAGAWIVIALVCVALLATVGSAAVFAVASLLTYAGARLHAVYTGGAIEPHTAPTIRSIGYSPTPLPDHYDNAQKVALRAAYRNAMIADKLRTYCADYANGGDGSGQALLHALGEYTLLNCLSFGEPFVESRLESFVSAEQLTPLLEIIRSVPTRAVHEAYAITVEKPTMSYPPFQMKFPIDPTVVARFSYGEFTAKLPFKRYWMLHMYASDVDIAIAFMQYHSILGNYFTRALPIDIVAEYVEAGANVEAFASPFNTQIMRTERSAGASRFCSVFDSDVVFNSYGSFFNVGTAGKFMIVMPPHVESVLMSALQKCIRERDADGNTRFVFYAPMSSGAHAVATSYAPDRVRTLPTGTLTLERADGSCVDSECDMFLLDMSEPVPALPVVPTATPATTA